MIKLTNLFIAVFAIFALVGCKDDKVSDNSINFYDGEKLLSSFTQVLNGDNGSVTFATWSKFGHNFEGWLDEAGIEYKAGESYTVSRNAKFYAKWSVLDVPEGMVLVDGGTFTMGSPRNEALRGKDETRHKVTVSSFYMGIYEVTQKEWKDVMGSNSCFLDDDTMPVRCITWYDALDYCNKRSIQEGLDPVYAINSDNVFANFTRNGYRLPTEAEWEYAARGGKEGNKEYLLYSGSNNPDEVAWYESNSDLRYDPEGASLGMARVVIGKPHPVGEKLPNLLGLYDMSGNVSEWIWDWYGEYSRKSQIDPTGPDLGVYRVVRGGDWYRGTWEIRSADRSNNDSPLSDGGLGFRVVRR